MVNSMKDIRLKILYHFFEKGTNILEFSDLESMRISNSITPTIFLQALQQLVRREMLYLSTYFIISDNGIYYTIQKLLMLKRKLSAIIVYLLTSKYKDRIMNDDTVVFCISDLSEIMYEHLIITDKYVRSKALSELIRNGYLIRYTARNFIYNYRDKRLKEIKDFILSINPMNRIKVE